MKAALLTLLAIAGFAAHAKEPVKVENAALLYWHAFAVMPERDKETKLPYPIWGKPVSPAVVNHVDRAEHSLALLKDGAQIQDCNWGVPWHRGTNTVLGHLRKSRQLTQLACLKIRILLADGKSGEALKLASAALAFSRRLGLDSALIGAFVQLAAEEMLIRTIAWHAGNIPKKELRTFAGGLSKLPPRMTFSQALESENRFTVGTLPQNPKGRRGNNVALFGADIPTYQASPATLATS